MTEERLSYSGFIVILVAIAAAGISSMPPLLLYAIAGASLIGAALMLLAGRWRHWGARLQSAALVVASALLFIMASVDLNEHGLWRFGVVALLSLCIITFRLTYWWWFWSFILLFALTSVLGSIISTAVVTLPFLLFVLAANFLFKVIADNSPNMRAAWSNNPVRSWDLIKHLWPVGVSALFGIWGNIALQSYLVDQVYRQGVVEQRPSQIRNLELDADFTVELRSSQAIDQILEQGSNSRTAVLGATTEAERRVLRLFGALEPRPYDTARICKGFIGAAGRDRTTAERIGNLFSTGKRQKFSVDMRQQCAGAFGELSTQTAQAFNESMNAIEGEVANSASDFNEEFSDSAMSAEALAVSQALVLADRARFLLSYLFLVLRILSVWSWIMLAGAIVAATINVLGRLLYDADRSVFALNHSKQSPNWKKLRFSAHDTLRLDLPGDFRLDGETEPLTHYVSRWYVAFDAARYGRGTHMDTRVPLWSSCFFRRLFTQRLFLTRVTIPSSNAHSNSLVSDPPCISASGDVKLLDIYLEPDREIVFRLSDLIAFSKGIRITSHFSMNVATEIFGLGSFYTVARGEGRIVLRTEGHEHILADKSDEFPSGILLAWDHRAPFSLAQVLGLRGVWGNSASLIPSEAGLAILDESRPGDPSVMRRLWRILRFAVMPV